MCISSSSLSFTKTVSSIKKQKQKKKRQNLYGECSGKILNYDFVIQNKSIRANINEFKVKSVSQISEKVFFVSSPFDLQLFFSFFLIILLFYQMRFNNRMKQFKHIKWNCRKNLEFRKNEKQHEG